MASRGVNKVILVGNLGNDPETRFFPDGGAVTNASIATSETWKDKQTGQMQEKTEWHRIVAWRHLAERAERYLRKGKQVYIEGRIETRKWTGQDGNDRYTTEIVANDVQFLGSRDDNAGGGRPGPPARLQAAAHGPGVAGRGRRHSRMGARNRAESSRRRVPRLFGFARLCFEHASYGR